jgi:hypothetical protein
VDFLGIDLNILLAPLRVALAIRLRFRIEFLAKEPGNNRIAPWILTDAAYLSPRTVLVIGVRFLNISHALHRLSELESNGRFKPNFSHLKCIVRTGEEQKNEGKEKKEKNAPGCGPCIQRRV